MALCDPRMAGMVARSIEEFRNVTSELRQVRSKSVSVAENDRGNHLLSACSETKVRVVLLLTGKGDGAFLP
jgi:hypothetical protein